MTAFPNPPILSSAPTNGQIPVYNSTTNEWDPGTASTAPITVPQAAIAAQGAISAKTAVAVVAADAATQSGSYVQADVQTIATLATANKAQVNALVTDVGTLVTELTSLRTKFNTLLTELATAAIISP